MQPAPADRGLVIVSALLAVLCPPLGVVAGLVVSTRPTPTTAFGWRIALFAVGVGLLLMSNGNTPLYL